jgi:hypothetical protein
VPQTVIPSETPAAQENHMDNSQYYGLALWVWLFVAPIVAALMSLRAGRPPFNVR